MAIFTVHFKWKEKDAEIKARDLDMTHPYFVSIKDLVFESGKKLIINPAEDDIIRRFGNSKHLMIPFNQVTLIEEVDEENSRGNNKLKTFPIPPNNEI